MIQSKKDLRFYIAADRIMNGFSERKTIKERIMNDIDCPVGGVIISYLYALRHYAYYRNNIKRKMSLRALCLFFWHRRWQKLSLELGFSIGPNSLGYGVVIPHHGTIVVNQDAQIGNFAVLHTCTCIAGGDKVIGDFFYLSTGSQVVDKLLLGEGVTVAAHSLVNRSDSISSHCLLAGAPAEVKCIDYPLWPQRDGKQYTNRVEKVLALKEKLYKTNIKKK